jgi:hypothetical protein
MMENDEVTWFWIGRYADYDGLLGVSDFVGRATDGAATKLPLEFELSGPVRRPPIRSCSR